MEKVWIVIRADESRTYNMFGETVTLQGGVLSPAPRPFIHRSKKAAQQEAERLAKSSPGKHFIVFEAVSSSKRRPDVETVEL